MPPPPRSWPLVPRRPRLPVSPPAGKPPSKRTRQKLHDAKQEYHDADGDDDGDEPVGYHDARRLAPPAQAPRPKKPSKPPPARLLGPKPPISRLPSHVLLPSDLSIDEVEHILARVLTWQELSIRLQSRRSHGSVDLGPRSPSSVAKPESQESDTSSQAPTQSVTASSNQSPNAPYTPLADELLEAFTLQDFNISARSHYR